MPNRSVGVKVEDRNLTAARRFTFRPIQRVDDMPRDHTGHVGERSG